MEITKLIELLTNAQKNSREELKVVVEVKSLNGKIGTSAHDDIRNIRIGFDWDKGYLFLKTASNLVTLSSVDEERIKKLTKRVAELEYENRILKQGKK